MVIDYSKLFDRETLKRILAKYRKRIIKEVYSAKDLTSLLMKGTQGGWTKSEFLNIKTHFVILGKKIPVFMVFLLPGGFILLPVLIEVLDRRKNNIPVSEDRRKAPKKVRGKKL